jgi:peptidyl-prolyl cis-trans isomerase SurA
MFSNFKTISKYTKTLLICFCVTGFALATQPASYAQKSLGIAAVVNDDMISMYDLNARLSAVIAFARFPNSQETRRRLAPQVLRGLIDERVKVQEAKRLGITVSPGRVASAKAGLERQTGMKPGQLKEFIKRNQLQESTIDDQMETTVLWNKMVSAKSARNVSISDEEVNEIFEKLKNNKGKLEDLASEIFLPINQPTQEQEVTKLAERLVQQLRKGASFPAIAQNFSQSSSVSSGGDLGWTMRGEHSAELNQIIQTLKPGQLSEPMRTLDGIYIVLLRATRQSRGLDGPPPGPEKVKLYQLHMALPPNPAPELTQQIKSRAQADTWNLIGCKNMDTLAKKIGSPLSGELGTFEISKISPKMQTLVSGVPAGRVSQPQQVPEGVIVLMVCERIAPKVKKIPMETQRNNIKEQLRTERLDLAAKRYIRDLRRASFIDVRLGNR